MKKINFDKKEILWNLINSLLAGGLVLLGNLSGGEITWKGLGFATIAALTVALIQFKNYWDGEKKECSTKIFAFIKP